MANEWKDESDKVMPVKQWLEERKYFQVLILSYINISHLLGKVFKHGKMQKQYSAECLTTFMSSSGRVTAAEGKTDHC